MPFIDNILNYKSIAIVGLEKNTGKTECLNYVVEKLSQRDIKIALTSIGIDGESIDAVTNTPKPEIELPKNTVFVTLEKFYNQRKLVSEVIDLSKTSGFLGRYVTARSLSKGKVILAGPSSTDELKSYLDKLSENNNIVVVDGALSRLSLASPAITDCMILNTGAAVSTSAKQLVDKTKFTVDLINLPKANLKNRDDLLAIENGIFGIDENDLQHKLDIPSGFLLSQNKTDIFHYGKRIFVSGALSNQFLNFVISQPNSGHSAIIVKDFTKVFATKDVFEKYIRCGGKIEVVERTNLLAVCLNPLAPNGFVFDSEGIRNKLSQAINMSVYDVRHLRKTVI
ncbi:MAG: hypothetical protein GX140_02385 [Bacteroidales bacterium]|jgi:hypothetical protein|nr:hypothetical protein [Bacteroidales bacterium]